MPKVKAPWLEVELELPSEVADDVAALLVDAGAEGAEISGAGPTCCLRLAYAALADAGEVAAAATRLLRAFGVDLSPAGVRVARRQGADWAEEWKKLFAPLAVGDRFWIVPSWEESFQPPSGALPIVLDPGMAFGTGQHATSAMCLEILESRLAAQDDARRGNAAILDVGCGSGILAIAAAKLGVARVVAIDNDPDAVKVARDNAERNAVHERISISDAPLAKIDGRFDCVLANILAPTLVDMAPDLWRVTAGSGLLVLSGLLVDQEEEVRAAFEAHASEAGTTDSCVVTRRVRGDWVALALSRCGT